MTNVTILYFDTLVNAPKAEMLKQLSDITGGVVIAMPKTTDILMDTSVDQLLQIRDTLNTVIQSKLNSKNNNLLQ